jgi:hypothetical protein
VSEYEYLKLACDFRGGETFCRPEVTAAGVVDQDVEIASLAQIAESMVD